MSVCILVESFADASARIFDVMYTTTVVSWVVVRYLVIRWHCTGQRGQRRCIQIAYAYALGRTHIKNTFATLEFTRTVDLTGGSTRRTSSIRHCAGRWTITDTHTHRHAQMDTHKKSTFRRFSVERAPPRLIRRVSFFLLFLRFFAQRFALHCIISMRDIY